MKGKRLQLLFKKNKKIIIAASLLATLAIGETFAWIAPTLEVKNELTAHTTNVIVDEPEFEPGTDSGTHNKQVIFKNTGDSDVFIRMSYEEYWQSGAGNDKIQMSNTVLDNGNRREVATKNFNGSFNPQAETELWIPGNDGWYYYKKVVPAGQSLEHNVLESVTFPAYTGAFAEYENAEYYLHFKVEAVQASTNKATTLNCNAVNHKATAEVFGPWADIKFDSNGPAYNVEWNFTPYTGEGGSNQ